MFWCFGRLARAVHIYHNDEVGNYGAFLDFDNFTGIAQFKHTQFYDPALPGYAAKKAFIYHHVCRLAVQLRSMYHTNQF